MHVWPIKNKKGPGYEPDNSQRPEHVEHGLPAHKLTEVPARRHGDHCSESGAGVGKGRKPKNIQS